LKGNEWVGLIKNVMPGVKPNGIVQAQNV